MAIILSLLFIQKSKVYFSAWELYFKTMTFYKAGLVVFPLAVHQSFLLLSEEHASFL